jgi:transcriptional regulator with XRE-family HTH domain
MSMPSRRCPDPFAVQLGERIRQLRKEKKMTLPELSRASGISRGHLSDIERGQVVMTIGTLASLAGALEVPPFVICLVPKDDPEVAVIDHALCAAGGDPKKAAEVIRAVILEVEEQKGPAPDK